MNKLENFFNIETAYDSKHILNTCNRQVPQQYLDEIEKGCSIEQIEKMMADKFDVFRYKTQITVHGLFPELSTNRIGYYVNLVQNKNKSIGIRYSAIDYEKKSRLFSMLSKLKLFCVSSSSSAFYIYKMKQLPNDWKNNREEILRQVADFKASAEKIDRSLFVGNIDCFLANDWGRVFICLTVNISSFYEKNFQKLFENLSGMTFADGKQKYDAIVAKETAEKAERDAKWEAELEAARKEREEKEALYAEKAKKFLEQGYPEGYAVAENYMPKSGDMIAFVAKTPDYEPYWKFYTFKKSFGRIIRYQCDQQGNRDTRISGLEVLRPFKSVLLKRAA